MGCLVLLGEPERGVELSHPAQIRSHVRAEAQVSQHTGSIETSSRHVREHVLGQGDPLALAHMGDLVGEPIQTRQLDADGATSIADVPTSGAQDVLALEAAAHQVQC